MSGTRKSQKVVTTRDDIVTLRGQVNAPTGKGGIVIQGVKGKKIKVYDAGYYNNAQAGTRYFYFGTTTSPTTKGFCISEGVTPTNIHRIFNHPRISADGDSLYLYSSLGEISDFEVGYVQE